MERISQREVKRQYAQLEKLCEKHKEEFEERVGAKNVYTCEKGHTTTTIDADGGTTPFMHTCHECGGIARSSFYNHPLKDKFEPVEEWYRPSLEECMKYRDQPGLLDHIFQGGLITRKIKKD